MPFVVSKLCATFMKTTDRYFFHNTWYKKHNWAGDASHMPLVHFVYMSPLIDVKVLERMLSNLSMFPIV